MNKLFIKMLIGKLKKLNPFHNIIIVRIPTTDVDNRKVLTDILELNEAMSDMITSNDLDSAQRVRDSIFVSAALTILFESSLKNPQDVMHKLVDIMKQYNELGQLKL